jgi:protocatechuate 3,4-dioxygenase alpha subunit
MLTPSQTVGPFFHHCLLCTAATRNVLTTPDTKGERIRIEGHVYDGDGVGVPDAIVEIWQADGEGRFGDAYFGYGRSGTDASGAYWFETIKPGAVMFDRERKQAPHVCVAVFARGLLNHLLTRMYFADEAVNADDPVLRCVPVERRDTLLTQRQDHGEKAAVYLFDIVLQGASETVFFR